MCHAFLLCIVLASGCSRTAPLIEAGRAGDVAIGDSVQAIHDAYREPRRRSVDLRLEGMPSPAIELMPDGATRGDALVAELLEQNGTWRVFRIQVRGPLFETARGVGVGDSVGDLRAAHSLGRLIAGEGNVGIRVEALSATFLIDPVRVQREWVQANDASRVPDDVEIQRILLTRTSVGP